MDYNDNSKSSLKDRSNQYSGNSVWSPPIFRYCSKQTKKLEKKVHREFALCWLERNTMAKKTKVLEVELSRKPRHKKVAIKVTSDFVSNEKLDGALGRLKKLLNESPLEVPSAKSLVFEVNMNPQGKMRFSHISGEIDTTSRLFANIRGRVKTIAKYYDVNTLKKEEEVEVEPLEEVFSSESRLAVLDKKAAKAVRDAIVVLKPYVVQARNLSEISEKYEELCPGETLSASKEALEELRALLDS